MRLVVDSNVLFTFFWKNSVFNEICEKTNLVLFSSEYMLKEINKYAEDIIRRSNISKEEFNELRKKLTLKVEFISLDEYSQELKEAILLNTYFSKQEELEFFKDIDLFALALKLNCPIWTNDSLLKKQKRVIVLSTKELIELINV